MRFRFRDLYPGGGGGGTQMLFGRGCAAEASKPVPIFKGHFGGKGYPLLGIFSQENDVFVYFSDKMGEITKVGACLGIFPAQNRDPCLGLVAEESPIRAAHPRLPYYVSTPPPPPGDLYPSLDSFNQKQNRKQISLLSCCILNLFPLKSYSINGALQ